MNSIDKVVYPKDTQFSKEQLLGIKPNHVRKWLCKLAYGTETPDEDACPRFQRANSLRKAKSGISFFHPNKHVPWLEGRGGNPTIHPSISQMIKKVEAHEMRGRGVQSNMKRAYSKEEFYKILQILRIQEDFDSSVKYTTMSLWAKHLIHRMDDTCHFQVDAPHGSHEFDYVVLARTKWSKNVKNDRNCPDQILFASGCWFDCIHLHLALYLECWLKMNLPNIKFLFTEIQHNDTTGPSRLNQNYVNRMRQIWNMEEFKALEDQVGAEEDRRGIGGHSLRKFASTNAKRNGARTDQIEYRGRWSGDKARSICATSYIESKDPYTDAFVASVNCEGGPVAYDIADGMEVPDDFLFTHVVPSIRERFSRICTASYGNITSTDVLLFSPQDDDKD
jgi:hypothetical protein